MFEVALFSILLAALRMATPLIFASLGGLLSERSGVINVALEGFMLMGALTAACITYQTHSPWLGWILAFAAGVITSALYAVLVINLKADQIVTGTAINILATGVAPFITKILFDSTGSTPSLPLNERFIVAPIYMAILVLICTWVVIYKTKWGLWISFAGEHPQALESSGIKLKTVRWLSVLMSGGLAAWGGASLSICMTSSYSPLMTGGRGFMALAALIFGKWKPLPTFLTCLFFGLADEMQIRLQGESIFGFTVPSQFIQILPYVLTIIALAGFLGHSRSPKAIGTN